MLTVRVIRVSSPLLAVKLARHTVLFAALCLSAACGPAIRVKHIDEATVHRQLTSSVLTTGQPSDFSVQLLDKLNLTERFADDPEGALAVVHDGLGADDESERLFALAELSFAHALETESRSHFLATAIYAYAYMFPAEPDASLDAFDRRFRLAADLYNRGLTRGLAADDEGGLSLGPGTHELPMGTLRIDVDETTTVLDGNQLERFVSASDLAVKGLRNHYRHAGLGVPVAAKVGSPVKGTRSDRWRPARRYAALTAVLLLPDVRHGLTTGSVESRLELVDPDLSPTIDVEGRAVPLESDSSAVLGYGVAGSPLWEFELAGFRLGDFRPTGLRSDNPGLYMMSAYRPGRIPVVFVHGTASSPLRWAEMVNELANDPALRGRLQFWYFMYNTGNPILLSAAKLREALTAIVAEKDPEGRDPALRQMVVIGHSQGGLLTKLTVVDSGTRFWDKVSSEPIDDLNVRPETRALLREALFVEPLPFVKTVVFVATPHRGSFLARRSLAGLVTRLVTLPGRLVDAGGDLFKALSADPTSQAIRSLGRMPTSIDNMKPGSPFLTTLVELPIADGVAAHSIIAVRGDGPPEDGNDGVVEYRSAHLEDVASERIVRSSHTVQGHPDAIAELRRILLLELSDEAAAPP